MVANRIFSTAEMCEMLGISKSTLFRWESEGVLQSVGRDPIKNERRYSYDHIIQILSKQYEQVAKMDTAESMRHITEILPLRKFQGGNEDALDDLAAIAVSETLSQETIRTLLQMTQYYQLSDSTFRQIIQIIYDQIEKLEIQSRAER